MKQLYPYIRKEIYLIFFSVAALIFLFAMKDTANNSFSIWITFVLTLLNLVLNTFFLTEKLQESH